MASLIGGANGVADKGRAGGSPERTPGPACPVCERILSDNQNTRTCRCCERIAHSGCGRLSGYLTAQERVHWKADFAFLCAGCRVKTGRAKANA